jgi:hypothetical protein
LREHSGTQFDPAVLEAFIAVTRGTTAEAAEKSDGESLRPLAARVADAGTVESALARAAGL